MFSLTVESGKHAGKKVKLHPGEVIIGRDEAAKLRIASSDVSRKHCRLVVTAEGVMVHDLDSRNGTFIDGAPIHKAQELESGSTLTVGPMTFRLEGGQPRKKPAKEKVLDSEQKASQGLSDDEIASLLTDEIPTLAASDTTVGPAASQPTPLRTAAPRPAVAPKRIFRTIAEEAQEIIRLHLESLGDGGARR